MEQGGGQKLAPSHNIRFGDRYGNRALCRSFFAILGRLRRNRTASKYDLGVQLQQRICARHMGGICRRHWSANSRELRLQHR